MRPGWTLLWLGLVGCDDGLAALDPAEWLPGGAGTNTLLAGSNAYLMPARTLSAEHEQDFYSGNSFFNQAWVEAPSSTAARDGLGPLFNARSCSACHFRDGKGLAPEDGEGPLAGLLLRLSVPGPDGPAPHPVYGGQLQDLSNDGVPAEAHARVAWSRHEVTLGDGTVITLRAPRFELSALAYGPLGDDTLMSARTAPHMVGLGLLEGIAEADLEALADPDDDDGDGVSGRLQRHADGAVGRFGWKGDAPDVAAQVAGAFAGDMGLTSHLHLADDCTPDQSPCREAASGGAPEVDDHVFDLVVLYSRSVAVPARREADDPAVLRGKRLFHDVGCAACHVPDHTTASAALPELNGERIWPYTDLLLHDMGDGLADDRPVLAADGRSWRTAPLWGLGLIDEVGGRAGFLHDGRAETLAEAILWHGGEAQAARDGFVDLPADDRDALLRFVDDL